MTTQRELTHNGPRRAAMMWMLHAAGVSYAQIARLTGNCITHVSNNGRKYDAIIRRRQIQARDWSEPRAQRLRSAGAIP